MIWKKRDYSIQNRVGLLTRPILCTSGSERVYIITWGVGPGSSLGYRPPALEATYLKPAALRSDGFNQPLICSPRGVPPSKLNPGHLKSNSYRRGPGIFPGRSLMCVDLVPASCQCLLDCVTGLRKGAVLQRSGPERDFKSLGVAKRYCRINVISDSFLQRRLGTVPLPPAIRATSPRSGGFSTRRPRKGETESVSDCYRLW